MTKRLDATATGYARSPWTGERYARPQTHRELLEESTEVLRRHPTIMQWSADDLRRLIVKGASR